MKRLRVFAFPAMLFLGGCQDQQGVIQQTADGRETGLIIYTDKDTGCQYVRPAYHDGFQPRMNRDGKQMCDAKV